MNHESHWFYCSWCWDTVAIRRNSCFVAVDAKNEQQLLSEDILVFIAVDAKNEQQLLSEEILVLIAVDAKAEQQLIPEEIFFYCGWC